MKVPEPPRRPQEGFLRAAGEAVIWLLILAAVGVLALV